LPGLRQQAPASFRKVCLDFQPKRSRAGRGEGAARSAAPDSGRRAQRVGRGPASRGALGAKSATGRTRPVRCRGRELYSCGASTLCGRRSRAACRRRGLNAGASAPLAGHGPGRWAGTTPGHRAPACRRASDARTRGIAPVALGSPVHRAAGGAGRLAHLAGYRAHAPDRHRPASATGCSLKKRGGDNLSTQTVPPMTDRPAPAAALPPGRRRCAARGSAIAPGTFRCGGDLVPPEPPRMACAGLPGVGGRPKAAEGQAWPSRARQPCRTKINSCLKARPA
jgi:hypothetical protein